LLGRPASHSTSAAHPDAEFDDDAVHAWPKAPTGRWLGSSVERSDQFVDRWPRVRCGWERQVAKRAASADDGVGAERVDVLGRPTESATGADKSHVHPDRSRRPHLTERSSSYSQQFVQDPISVSDDVEREPKARPVGGQTLGGRERDDRDPGVTELVEVIAHGDHVFLTGQSSEVPVQDQDEWSATHRGGAPRPTRMIGELEVGERLTEGEGHVVRQTKRLD